MNTPHLVLITGPPAAGKSTLAKRLASGLGMPLISKDDLKVILYETLGWGGRERDRRVSDAAYELMYHLIETEVAASRSLVLESNFRPEAGRRIARLQEQFGFGVIQIRCWAPREVLVRRLEARVAAGDRHPGHADAETLAGELEGLLATGSALALDGPLFEVDTSDPERNDDGALAGAVWKSMQEGLA